MADVDLTVPRRGVPRPDLAPRDMASQEERLVDATLVCLARWGVTKTTLDDVARQAGCSRATVYRVFPGGKESLLEATVRREIDRFIASITAVLVAETDLEGALVGAVSAAARHLSQHEALQFLLAHEPEVVLPLVAFSRMDRVYATVRDVFAPHLAPHVGHERAPRVAEWLARLTVSYTLCPSDAYDVRDPESVRELVRTFVLPGLRDAVATKKG
jgi:AcrR family transcriptional regulator